MAFVNRLLLIVPSFGQPIQNDTLFLKQATALSTTSAQATTLAGLAPALRDGWVRCKIYGAGGTSPTVVKLQVVVTDGTTFVVIGDYNPATATTLSTTAAAGSPYTNGGSLGPPVVAGGVDMIFPFLTDLAINQVSVLTTLGGTSPTASLDVEVAATN